MKPSGAQELPFLEDEKEFAHLNYDNSFKDVLFLFLFALNILLVVSVAFSYGIISLSNGGPDIVKVSSDGHESEQTAEFSVAFLALMGCLLVIGVAVLLSVFWILFLARLAAHIINAIFISIIAVPLIFGIVVLLFESLVLGAILLALSVGMLVFSLLIRPRMEFAVSNLRVAAAAILQMPVTIAFALIALVLQIGFAVVWVIATVGYATNSFAVSITAAVTGEVYELSDCTTYHYATDIQINDISLICDSSHGHSCRACICEDSLIYAHDSCAEPAQLYVWPFVLLLLSLFWTSAVISNIVHCTTAAAIATWWAVPGFPDASIVHAAFTRSITTSLGSICMGSLLVALIRTIRSVFYVATQQCGYFKKIGTYPTPLIGRGATGSRIIGVCQSCNAAVLFALRLILRLLDWLVTYFNRYALCFVAIHRYDFLSASQAATALFQSRGLTAFLNDDILDVILFVGHSIIGLVCYSVALAYSRAVGVGHACTLLLTVFGLICGFLISTVTMSTISSAVATVYVLYAENSEALEFSHPEAFEILFPAYTKFFSKDSRNTSATTNAAAAGDTALANDGKSGKINNNTGAYLGPDFYAGFDGAKLGEFDKAVARFLPMEVQNTISADNQEATRDVKPSRFTTGNNNNNNIVRQGCNAPLFAPVADTGATSSSASLLFHNNETRQQQHQQQQQQQSWLAGASSFSSGISGGMSKFINSMSSNTQNMLYGYSPVPTAGEEADGRGSGSVNAQTAAYGGSGQHLNSSTRSHNTTRASTATATTGTTAATNTNSSNNNSIMPDMTSALSAIGSLTSRLSNSVFSVNAAGSNANTYQYDSMSNNKYHNHSNTNNTVPTDELGSGVQHYGQPQPQPLQHPQQVPSNRPPLNFLGNFLGSSAQGPWGPTTRAQAPANTGTTSGDEQHKRLDRITEENHTKANGGSNTKQQQYEQQQQQQQQGYHGPAIAAGAAHQYHQHHQQQQYERAHTQLGFQHSGYSGYPGYAPDSARTVPVRPGVVFGGTGAPHSGSYKEHGNRGPFGTPSSGGETTTSLSASDKMMDVPLGDNEASL